MNHVSSYRRVIPVGYEVHELHLQGVTPLLMSSGEIDRQSDTYVAFRQLSRKRGKSFEDEARLRELEFYTRIYYDETVGCYIPSKNLKEMLRASATKLRKGEDVRRSVVIPEYRVPLVYDGPRSPKELWKHGGFAYTTMVANAGAGSGRVERTRPCFDEWELRTEIAFDPEDLDRSDVEFAVDRSQKYGLGDYRPEFGSFIPTLTFVRVQREDAAADGSKQRDGRAARASSKKAAAMLA